MRTIVCTIGLCGLWAGLQAQVPDFTPQTPLIGALLHDEREEAKRLLDAGADPNEGRFAGFPPLFLAITRQDTELVLLMAARGADLDARDASGSTALMWAAFDDRGDAALVEELLRLGADPLTPNNTGETALTWALRRGDTPAVATLRRAGASESARVRAAAQKAIALLQRSGAQFTQVSACYSCHHHSLPQMALGVARTRGLEVDEAAAGAQVGTVTDVLGSVYAEARGNRDRIPDPPIAVSYALLGLAAEGHPRNEMTESLADVISAWQGGNGAFHALPAIRPPLEASHVTATALSLRALQLYGRDAEPRIVGAREWLRGVRATSTEDRVMQLLGLVWTRAGEDDIRTHASALRAQQREDGGWAQLPGLETDAYATGQALVALTVAGQDPSSTEYRKGVGFLLRTQFPDGSWLVRSRTFPVQRPKDSGFPHGMNQWISAAGTSWAAMALALALPPDPSASEGPPPLF